MEGVWFNFCVISCWRCLLVCDRMLHNDPFFKHTDTNNTCIYMVFSLVCISGKLLVLWRLCNSWMTLSPFRFQKCINTREWMFLQSPVPFHIFHFVTSRFSKANLRASRTQNNPPPLHFFTTGWKLKTCFQGNEGKKKLPTEKTNNIWNGLICTGLASSGDVCQLRNMADRFLWNFYRFRQD